ncbi:MAG: hypothetical protein ACOC5T_01330 [Elusimicrobiota bacterium]
MGVLANLFKFNLAEKISSYIYSNGNERVSNRIHYSTDEKGKPYFFPINDDELRELENKDYQKVDVDFKRDDLLPPFLHHIIVNKLKENGYSNYGTPPGYHLPYTMVKEEKAIESHIEGIELRKGISISIEQIDYSTLLKDEFFYTLAMDARVIYDLSDSFELFEGLEGCYVYANRDFQQYKESQYLGKITEIKSEKGITKVKTTKGEFHASDLKLSTSYKEVKELVRINYNEDAADDIIRASRIAIGDYNEQGKRNKKRGDERMGLIREARDDLPNVFELPNETITLEKQMRRIEVE